MRNPRPGNRAGGAPIDRALWGAAIAHPLSGAQAAQVKLQQIDPAGFGRLGEIQARIAQHAKQPDRLPARHFQGRQRLGLQRKPTQYERVHDFF